MPYEREMLAWAGQNWEAARRNFRDIEEALRQSDLCYKGRCVQTLAAPKIFSKADADRMEAFIGQCFTVFNKVIGRYLADPAYRRLFPFSAALEQLILRSPAFGRNIPMARIDFFFDEETKEIKLCEVNTDGASAMNEDRILVELLPRSRAFRQFSAGKKFTSYELFDSWAHTFLALYREFSHSEKKPTAAIVDFMDRATLPEFRRFAQAFERAGMPALICDIRELQYKNGRLLAPDGTAIDAVYRRAVTTDILARIDEAGPFLESVGNVCIVGGFRSQIIHNKILFHILHREETLAFLNEGERGFVRAHVPRTYPLNLAAAEEHDLFAAKDKWIIKPEDQYGSRGVYAGRDVPPDEWRRLVEASAGVEYLFQEYCTPYRSPNIDFSEAEPMERLFSNITGVFCYNEQPRGLYSRLSKGGVISSQYDEKTVATLVCGSDTI